MACYNHPNAHEIDECARCEQKLCGQCAKFLDSGVYCEKCASAVEAEMLVSARRVQKAQLERQRALTPEQSGKVEVEPPSRKASSDKVILWLGLGGSSALMFLSLLIYAFPLLFDTEAADALAAEQSAEDCRLVFEEIGFILEDGGPVDPSLRCVETNVPNIVSREGNVVRVSHPNPSAYGLREMYVTSDSHEVVFVE